MDGEGAETEMDGEGAQTSKQTLWLTYYTLPFWVQNWKVKWKCHKVVVFPLLWWRQLLCTIHSLLYIISLYIVYYSFYSELYCPKYECLNNFIWSQRTSLLINSNKQTTKQTRTNSNRNHQLTNWTMNQAQTNKRCTQFCCKFRHLSFEVVNVRWKL